MKQQFFLPSIIFLSMALPCVVVAGSGTEDQANSQDSLIKQYKDIPLKRFIRLRFTGFYTFHGKEIDLHPKNRRESHLNKYYFSGKSLKGSFVNFAPFNATNIKFLQKPQVELQQFCEMGNGEFKAVKYFTRDMVKKSYKNPVKAYLDVKTSLTKLRYSVGERHGLKLPQDAIEHLARKEYFRAEELNQKHDIKGSIQGYTAAVESGAFGRFVCLSKDTGSSQWGVSIKPILYKPSDSLALKKVEEAIYISIKPHS